MSAELLAKIEALEARIVFLEDGNLQAGKAIRQNVVIEDVWKRDAAIRAVKDPTERAKKLAAVPDHELNVCLGRFVNPETYEGIEHLIETVAHLAKRDEGRILAMLQKTGLSHQLVAFSLPVPAYVKVTATEDVKTSAISKLKYPGLSVSRNVPRYFSADAWDALVKKDPDITPTLQRGWLRVEAVPELVARRLQVGEVAQRQAEK